MHTLLGARLLYLQGAGRQIEEIPEKSGNSTSIRRGRKGFSSDKGLFDGLLQL